MILLSYTLMASGLYVLLLGFGLRIGPENMRGRYAVIGVGVFVCLSGLNTPEAAPHSAQVKSENIAMMCLQDDLAGGRNVLGNGRLLVEPRGFGFRRSMQRSAMCSVGSS